MTEKKNGPDSPDPLRRRAENLALERASQLPATEPMLSAEEARQTVHELQVHQIELEMQNEELRRAQQEVEASRAKYFELYDLAPVGYVSLDEKGRVALANLTAAGLLGVTREALVGQPLTRFILREDQDIFYRHQKQLREMEALQSCELRMLRPDAEPFWARLEATVTKEEDGSRLCRTVMGDITERKEADREREGVRSHLEAVNLLRQSLLAPAPLDQKLASIADCIVRTFDAEFCRIWLLGPGDLCERGCLHAAVTEGPHACRNRDRCLHLVGSMGRGTHTDGKIHNRIPLSCYRIGRVAAGEEPKFLVNDEENDPLLHHHDWAHDPGLVSSAGYQLCVPGGEPSGVLAVFARHALSSTDDAVLEGLSHTAALIVQKAAAEEAHDRLEEQLRDTRKTEAVVRLAGGVAHDFNNILTVILGHTGFALEATHEGEPLWEDLRDIQRAGERAAVLTHQLLAFSRKQLLRPRLLDLNELVSQLERMLQQVLGEDVGLVYELAPQLGSAMADPGQLQQALMNLVLNARDAMPEGGKLTFKTANVELDAAFAASHPGSKPGPYVRLSVSDSGCGMDEPTRDRIFEPFFTTKARGKGLGMGLSTVQGVVSQSGGLIRVSSEPAQGTTFDLFLPRLPVAAALGTLNVGVTACTGGTETILVVEDEDGLRMLVSRILRKAGYTVLTAANGVEALQLCASREAPPDLVLSDVVMPKMGGHRLAERLAISHPRLKLLFMSGYADDEAARYGVLDRGAPFIGKPFAADELTRKVREVLDSGATDG